MVIEDSLRFLASIYGAFPPSVGFSVEELAATEARLGVPLPRALHTLYRATGRMKALHAAHNRLVPPCDVDFAGDHLVVYEEHPCAVVWGIARNRLGEADPPVDRGQARADDTWDFVPEFGSVSELAAAQGAWQAVQGGLPFVGVKSEHPLAGDVVACLGAPALVTRSMRSWLVDGGVVVEANGDYVGLAARDAGSFLCACATLGIDVERWDYATVRDGG